jgi:hypothetical protein
MVSFPAAKPRALVCEPLKAARWGRERGPTELGPPYGGCSSRSSTGRNTFPGYRRSCYKVFWRHFGMKTTWYLYTHFVWFRFSGSSIVDLVFVCFGGTSQAISAMDSGICQASTASPDETHPGASASSECLRIRGSG